MADRSGRRAQPFSFYFTGFCASMCQKHTVKWSVAPPFAVIYIVKCFFFGLPYPSPQTPAFSPSDSPRLHSPVPRQPLESPPFHAPGCIQPRSRPQKASRIFLYDSSLMPSLIDSGRSLIHALIDPLRLMKLCLCPQ